MAETNHFFDTIYKLRKEEELLLFKDINDISELELVYVSDFLEEEYTSETVNYPFETIEFNPSVALWAAKIVYFSAQFLLYRENDVEKMKSILSVYPDEINPSAILSADLVLRFLPQIYKEAKAINPDDELVPIIKEILNQWVFSSVELNEYNEGQNLETIFENKCVNQLFTDRIINFKAQQFLQNKIVKQFVMHNLGAYSNLLWKNIEH